MHKHLLFITSTLGLSLALGGCAQVPALSSLDGISLTQRTTGGVSLALVLPASRGVQALPDGTSAVTITVTSSKLAAPVTQTITQSQFVNNRAVMQIDKLPAGDVQVDATIYDANQNAIALGGAKATVTAGQVIPVSLNLLVKGATGGAAVTIDAKTVYDKPVVTIPAAIATQSFTLQAPSGGSAGWVRSIHLNAGQTVNLASTGRMGYGYYWSASYDYNYYSPDGDYEMRYGYYSNLASTLAPMSVVGRFVEDTGSGHLFQVGTASSYQAPASGTLYLGANTWQTSDLLYAGSFTVTLSGN